MRILYDGAIYGLQAAGGINRYFANLIGALPPSFAPTLLMREPHATNYPTHPNLTVLQYKGFRPGRISAKVEEYYYAYLAAFSRYDIAHPTYYTLLTRREVSAYRCPVVITVWDMIHELFAEQLDPTGEHAAQKRKAILAAQAVICISENTKRDLIERYSLPERQVATIGSQFLNECQFTRRCRRQQSYLERGRQATEPVFRAV